MTFPIYKLCHLVKMESESCKQVAKLNIIVSLPLGINAMTFIENVLCCSLSFRFKNKIKKYWKQGLNNWYTRHLIFKVICIRCDDNDAYFMVAL